jgi:MoxR-like ATPase
MILADEINRTPPKTQAALLEAMQERQITVGGETLMLPRPFYVLATQNPIEMEGTYALPEAQLDRFLLNIVVNYLSEEEEVQVVQRTTSGYREQVNPIFTAEQLITFQQVVQRVPCASDVVRYAVRLSAASRPGEATAQPFVKDWVNWGAGTRASQSLILAAKARALLSGRSHVGYEDVDSVAHPVLRHRILLNYRAEAEGITVDHIISRLLQAVVKGA